MRPMPRPIESPPDTVSRARLAEMVTEYGQAEAAAVVAQTAWVRDGQDEMGYALASEDVRALHLALLRTIFTAVITA